MDSKLLEILKFLEHSGLGGPNNIEPIINKRFPMLFSDKLNFDINRTAVLDFLHSIENEIKFHKEIDKQISAYNAENMPTKWLNSEMRVSLLQAGIYSLNRERDRQLSISTNKSVKETNEAIVKNSGDQKDILDRQTKIFLGTAIFTLLIVILTGISTCHTIQQDTSQKQLQQQSKEIQSLHNQLLQLKNDSSLLIKAMKNCPKNY